MNPPNKRTHFAPGPGTRAKLKPTHVTLHRKTCIPKLSRWSSSYRFRKAHDANHIPAAYPMRALASCTVHRPIAQIMLETAVTPALYTFATLPALGWWPRYEIWVPQVRPSVGLTWARVTLSAGCPTQSFVWIEWALWSVDTLLLGSSSESRNPISPFQRHSIARHVSPTHSR